MTVRMIGMSKKLVCEIVTQLKLFKNLGWVNVYSLAYKRESSVVAFFEDISSDYSFVQSLSKKISKGKVSEVHFRDVIEDEMHSG